MSQQAYDDATTEDRTHFMRCGECGEWLDCRDLDEVFQHEDHQPHLDIPYTGSQRVEQSDA